MNHKKYYLAYGSNLNIAQMKHRCPDAKPVGTAVIRDYELLFKGSKTGAYLTIEPQKGAYVPVGVWEVTADDESKLDLYEGYPTFYYKKEIRLPMSFLTAEERLKRQHLFTSCMRSDFLECQADITFRFADRAIMILALT